MAYAFLQTRSVIKSMIVEILQMNRIAISVWCFIQFNFIQMDAAVSGILRLPERLRTAINYGKYGNLHVYIIFHQVVQQQAIHHKVTHHAHLIIFDVIMVHASRYTGSVIKTMIVEICQMNSIAVSEWCSDIILT